MKVELSLLEKFFAGVCSDAEAKMVTDYLADEQSDLLPLHELMNKTADEVRGEPLPVELERSLNNGVYGFIYKRGAVIKRLLNISVAAAVLLPVLFAAYMFFRKTDARILSKIKGDTQASGKWKLLANYGSDTKKATLPDGTQVWLSAHSSIRYLPESFSTGGRELRLEGEAFFDVARNAGKAFTVHHGVIETHVLGTCFNVEAYPEEASIRVALVSGRVAVAPSGNPANAAPLKELKAGQVLSYHKASGRFKVKPLLTKDEQTWKQGNLVFDDIPLKDALLRLERKYGLTINYTNTIDVNKLRVTAVFRTGSAQEVLQNLLFIHNLHFRINKSVVTVY